MLGRGRPLKNGRQAQKKRPLSWRDLLLSVQSIVMIMAVPEYGGHDDVRTFNCDAAISGLR